MAGFYDKNIGESEFEPIYQTAIEEIKSITVSVKVDASKAELAAKNAASSATESSQAANLATQSATSASNSAEVCLSTERTVTDAAASVESMVQQVTEESQVVQTVYDAVLDLSVEVQGNANQVQTNLNESNTILGNVTSSLVQANAAKDAAKNSATESANSAELARQLVNQTFVSGGLFTLTPQSPYPLITNVVRDTIWIVQLNPITDPQASYVYTSGPLSGSVVKQGWQLYYDVSSNLWAIIPTSSTGIVSINGNTDINQTITATDVGGRYAAQTDMMPIANEAGYIASRWLSNLPKPKVQLDLHDSINLQSATGSSEFSRPSVATTINWDGSIRYYKSGEPRFSVDGLLLEGASTNYVVESEKLSNLTNGSLVTDGIWSAFNTTNTASIAYASIPSGNLLTVANGVRKVAVSMFAKRRGDYPLTIKLAGDSINKSTVRFNLKSSSATGDDLASNLSIVKYGDVFRVSAVFSVSKSSSPDVTSPFLITIENGVGVDQSNWTTGYQIEELPFTTSYIRTMGTAVTRAADTLVIPYEVSPNQPITIAANIKTFGYMSDARPIAHGGLQYCLLKKDNMDFEGYNFYYSGSPVNTTTLSGLFVYGYDGSNQFMYLNGRYLSAFTGTTVNNTKYPHMGFKLNAEADVPTANQHGGTFFGYIKDFRVWDKAFTMYELEEIR